MEPPEPSCMSAVWCWIVTNSTVLRDLGSLVLAALGILLLTWRSLSAGQQAIASQSQAEFARHNSLVNQYQLAADMLGSDLPSVRLGGIYGLCQLAQDFPKEFHVQVISILSAFVRYPPRKPERKDGVPKDEHYPTIFHHEEVQKIMEFFGGRTAGGRDIEKAEGYTIDLNGADLGGVILQAGSNLEGVSMQCTDLTGAFFTEVKGLTQDQINGSRNHPRDPAIFLDTVDAKTGLPFIVLSPA